MNKFLCIALFVVFLTCVGDSALLGASEKKEVVLKKFEVTMTVRYNAITLAEAAKKELEFKEAYKDACKVDIKLKAPEVFAFSVTSGSLLMP